MSIINHACVESQSDVLLPNIQAIVQFEAIVRKVAIERKSECLIQMDAHHTVADTGFPV
jgi:hypothetical protein